MPFKLLQFFLPNLIIHTQQLIRQGVFEEDLPATPAPPQNYKSAITFYIPVTLVRLEKGNFVSIY